MRVRVGQTVQPDPELIVNRLQADAAAAGLIIVHALANKLHQQVVTMYQHQVVQAAGILILRPVPVVRVHPAADLLPADLPQAVRPAAPVLPDLIG